MCFKGDAKLPHLTVNPNEEFGREKALSGGARLTPLPVQMCSALRNRFQFAHPLWYGLIPPALVFTLVCFFLK